MRHAEGGGGGSHVRHGLHRAGNNRKVEDGQDGKNENDHKINLMFLRLFCSTNTKTLIVGPTNIR